VPEESACATCCDVRAWRGAPVRRAGGGHCGSRRCRCGRRPGELLVRVAAATLNFNDGRRRARSLRTVRCPPAPLHPGGMEVLGYVEGAGTGRRALASASGWSPGRTAPSGICGARRRPRRDGLRDARHGPRAGGMHRPRPSTSRSTCRGWRCTSVRRSGRAETVLIHAACRRGRLRLPCRWPRCRRTRDATTPDRRRKPSSAGPSVPTLRSNTSTPTSCRRSSAATTAVGSTWRSTRSEVESDDQVPSGA